MYKLILFAVIACLGITTASALPKLYDYQSVLESPENLVEVKAGARKARQSLESDLHVFF